MNHDAYDWALRRMRCLLDPEDNTEILDMNDPVNLYLLDNLDRLAQHTAAVETWNSAQMECQRLLYEGKSWVPTRTVQRILGCARGRPPLTKTRVTQLAQEGKLRRKQSGNKHLYELSSLARYLQTKTVRRKR